MSTIPAIETDLTEQERQLIDVYRSISEQGKKFLIQTAEMLSKTHPGNVVVFPAWRPIVGRRRRGVTEREAREKYPNLMRVAHEINTFPEPYKVADKLLAVARAAGSS